MIQWTFNGTLSLGVHIDPLTRVSDSGPFGPYIDIHLGPVVVSLGNHPARASGLVVEKGIDAIMHPDRAH